MAGCNIIITSFVVLIFTIGVFNVSGFIGYNLINKRNSFLPVRQRSISLNMVFGGIAEKMTGMIVIIIVIIVVIITIIKRNCRVYIRTD